MFILYKKYMYISGGASRPNLLRVLKDFLDTKY